MHPSGLRSPNFPRPLGNRWVRDDSTPVFVPPDRRPDAVTFGRGNLPMNLDDEQRELTVEFAEHYLRCGPHELAWVRDQLGASGSYFFATRDHDDCEFFPIGHARTGNSRYRWVDVGEGVRLGWLCENS